MTQHFNARGRKNHINLRRAARLFGGKGWARTQGKWFHAATGLRR